MRLDKDAPHARTSQVIKLFCGAFKSGEERCFPVHELGCKVSRRQQAHEIFNGITCTKKASAQAYYSILSYLHMAVEIFFSGALPPQLAWKVARFVCFQVQEMEVCNMSSCSN